MRLRKIQSNHIFVVITFKIKLKKNSSISFQQCLVSASQSESDISINSCELWVYNASSRPTLTNAGIPSVMRAGTHTHSCARTHTHTHILIQKGNTGPSCLGLHTWSIEKGRVEESGPQQVCSLESEETQGGSLRHGAGFNQIRSLSLVCVCVCVCVCVMCV